MKINTEDKVREEIITAAAGVFETYGFARVSMQDISKATGKGRSTLYYYFGSKMEVFDAVAENFCRDIFDRCKTVIDQEASLAINIEKFHKKKLQEIKALTKKYHLVLEDLKQDPPLMLNKIRFLMDEEITLIHNALNWAINRNEIAFLNEEDSMFLAEMIVTSFKSFEQEIVLFNRFPNMEAKLSWLSLIFCKGLK